MISFHRGDVPFLPLAAGLVAILSGCDRGVSAAREVAESLSPRDQMDSLAERVARNTLEMESVLTIDHARLEAGYGIIEIRSVYPFETTIERLRAAVLAQSDTKWFGEVYYRAEADESGLVVPNATLLLFGGPAPGGRAMAEFPRLGLDAFCQKLLVYEDAEGRVRLAFNDIAAFAELHCGRSIPIHKGLNGRLTETFTTAVN